MAKHQENQSFDMPKFSLNEDAIFTIITLTKEKELTPTSKNNSSPPQHILHGS